HKDDPKEFQNILQVFFEKAMTSVLEIGFPFKQQSLFFKFMKIWLKISPSIYYRVNIYLLSTTTRAQIYTPNYVQAFK
ncbi:MAG TPA: hypothetical protein DIS69_06835, partial [Moraxellaceae bacterium]|nr:hypothetical protein [Moraxellaceae bacterium]